MSKPSNYSNQQIMLNVLQLIEGNKYNQKR